MTPPNFYHVNAALVTLTLYVCGHTQKSRTAIASIRALCQDHFKSCVIRVVDVLQDPAAAEAERVFATPTLIRRLPPPLRRIIGDLSDREGVLVGLDLKAHATPTQDSDPPTERNTR